jgi:hypothetical protein
MRVPKLIGGFVAVAVLAAALPERAEAQFPLGEWRAMPVVGVNVYDKATPFQTAAFVGGESYYPINNLFTIGFGISFARPIVDGSYYPLAYFRVHQDTSYLTQAGQQVTQVTYAGMLSVGVPVLTTGQLYAQGGLGGYTFFVDRQSMVNINKRTGIVHVSGLMIPIGGGISYALTQGAGIRLEVRDEIITSFDRERFNPVEVRYQNTCQVTPYCMPDLNGTPPAGKSSNHSLKFILGFELVPGR